MLSGLYELYQKNLYHKSQFTFQAISMLNCTFQRIYNIFSLIMENWSPWYVWIRFDIEIKLRTDSLILRQEIDNIELHLGEERRRSKFSSSSFNALPIFLLPIIYKSSKSSMALRYFARLQGIIQLTDEGGQFLGTRALDRASKILSASWVKKDTPLRTRLQLEITNLRAQIGFPDGEGDVTDHHIFPGNLIGKLVRNSMADVDRVAGVLAVNNYIASRQGIQRQLLPQIDQGDEDQAMDEVFASIFWFQYNLVLGPSQKIRENDPGQKIDKPILDAQVLETQNTYKQIQDAFNNEAYPTALTKFLSLREQDINNIVWQKANNKWKVPATNFVRKYPGTAGYCYNNYNGTNN